MWNTPKKFTKCYYIGKRDWRERNGSAATYTVLHDALCHSLVNRTDLAEQFITGNISLILQFNKNKITYKYSAKFSDTMLFGHCIFYVSF